MVHHSHTVLRPDVCEPWMKTMRIIITLLLLAQFNCLEVFHVHPVREIHLKNRNPPKLLHRAKDLVEVNVIEDPNYHIATDELA